MSASETKRFLVSIYPNIHLSQNNALVSISPSSRLLIILYFIIWRIMPELCSAVQADSNNPGMAVLLFQFRVLRELLLLFPFLIYRFAGTQIGWLHPLVLPTIFEIGVAFIRDPVDALTAPVMSLLQPPLQIFEHSFIGQFSNETRVDLDLKHAVLLLLSHLSYILGFALNMRSIHPIKVNSRQYSVSAMRMAIVVMLCFTAFYLLVDLNGGIIAHFSSLAFGRARMAQNVGHLLIVIKFLPYALVFWYLCKPEILTKIWFLVIYTAALLITFLATGSRSGIFVPIALLLAGWVLVNHKIPALRAVLLTVAVFLLLGSLGKLRSNAAINQGVTDFSMLTQLSLADTVEHTKESIEGNRLVSGNIAVLHKVPNEVPLLYGASYIGAALFFIPRSVWPDKPRGGGAHVGAIIYSGGDSTAGYLEAGFPIRAEIESYWNFGIIGVIIVALLLGSFHRFTVLYFLKNPQNPFRATLLLITLIILPSLESDRLVPYAQLVIMLAFLYLFVRRKALNCKILKVKL